MITKNGLGSSGLGFGGRHSARSVAKLDEPAARTASLGPPNAPMNETQRAPEVATEATEPPKVTEAATPQQSADVENAVGASPVNEEAGPTQQQQEQWAAIRKAIEAIAKGLEDLAGAIGAASK